MNAFFMKNTSLYNMKRVKINHEKRMVHIFIIKTIILNGKLIIESMNRYELRH